MSHSVLKKGIKWG